MNPLQRKVYYQTLTDVHNIVRTDAQVLLIFENTYREHLCNFSFSEYLASSGVIPLRTYQNALKQAAEAATDEASRRLVVSPTSPALLGIRYGLSPIILEGVCVSLKNLEIGFEVKSSTKKVKSKPPSIVTVKTPAPITEPGDLTDSQLQIIHQEIADIAGQTRPLYPQYCTVPNCSVCVEVFKTLRLTPCKHKTAKCITCGYYPHLPLKLWRSHGKRAHETRVLADLPKGDYGIENPLVEKQISEPMERSVSITPEERDSVLTDTSTSWIENVEAESSLSISSVPERPWNVVAQTSPAQKTIATPSLAVTTLAKRKAKDSKSQSKKRLGTVNPTRKIKSVDKYHY